MLRLPFAPGPSGARVLVGVPAHPEVMTLTVRDLVLGAAFLLAFPVAITLTDWASSVPTDPGAPIVAEGSARP